MLDSHGSILHSEGKNGTKSFVDNQNPGNQCTCFRLGIRAQVDFQSSCFQRQTEAPSNGVGMLKRRLLANSLESEVATRCYGSRVDADLGKSSIVV